MNLPTIELTSCRLPREILNIVNAMAITTSWLRVTVISNVFFLTDMNLDVFDADVMMIISELDFALEFELARANELHCAVYAAL